MSNPYGKWIRPDLRLAIYHRDGFACAYCGAGAEDPGVTLTLDHVVARAEGGSNAPNNLVTACLSCNSARQEFTLRYFLAMLRDKGVDTTGVAARVRKLIRRRVDRNEGKRLLADRRALRAVQVPEEMEAE